MSARKAVDSVLTDLERVRDTVAPFPSCVVGSAVLAAYHEDLGTQGISTEFNDIDVFTNSEAYYMLMGSLLHKGYKVMPNYERTPVRQLARGFGGWKTNSLKLEHPDAFEVNIICKYEGREELSDLYSVLLSFDWGGLLMGYDEFGVFHDMRAAVYPDVTNGDYGMVPKREATIGRGYMSEYIAARMFGRTAKLGLRGHTIDRFAEQVNNGYAVLSAHYQGFPDAKHQALASFYHDVQKLIEDKEWDKLDDVSKQLLGLGDGTDDEAQFAADIEALI
jgi:hypothetical protein